MAFYRTFAAALVVVVCCAYVTSACYAGPFFNGPACSSNTGVFGSRGHRVRYTISPSNNVNTLVCCKALGCGTGRARSCGSFTYYSIGCSNRGSFSGTVLWGNNLATPKVICKGNPTGTMYSFSH